MRKIFAPRVAKIPFTKAGYEKLLSDKAEFLRQRPEAVENLRLAREMGDLSENGYYKASRARLSFLDAQLRRLERLIKSAIVVESANSGKVDIGSVVIVADNNSQKKYTVVGGFESDPSKNTISYISPLGKALMGKSIGDNIEVLAPKGKVFYKIINVI